MTPPRKFKVTISQHARERARERFPGYKAARIADEVRIALAEGRIAAEVEIDCVLRNDPDCLYAWTPDEGRVFVLQANIFDGGTSFAVKTVLRKGGSGVRG